MTEDRRCVIYARVSQDSQRTNQSIPAQYHDCRKWIDEHGLTLVGDHYIDPMTGRDVEEGTPGSVPVFADDETGLTATRPVMYDMLKFLKVERVPLIVCWHFDRMARSELAMRVLDVEFERVGVSEYFVTGPNFDRNSPEGRMIRAVLLAQATYEVEHKAERSKMGKDSYARKGRHPSGRAAYGYTLDLHDEIPGSKGGLAIDEPKAAVVRSIFDGYLTGETIHGIARRLTEAEEKSPLGKRVWPTATVWVILKSEIYTGVSCWGKSTRKKLVDKTNQPRPREEWIPFAVPAIISREKFQQAQALLDFNRRMKHQQPKHDYLLSGLMYCRECGRCYVGNTVTHSNDHWKPTIRYIHRGCCNQSVTSHKVEDAVWNEVKQALLRPDWLKEIYEHRTHEDQYQQVVQQVAVCRVQLDRLALGLDRLIDLYQTGGMTRAEYDRKRSEALKKIATEENRCRRLEAQLDSGVTPEKIEAFAEFVANIREELPFTDDYSFQDKRFILRKLGVRVERSTNGDLDVSFIVGNAEAPNVGLDFRSR